jgi:hypothetical protein
MNHADWLLNLLEIRWKHIFLSFLPKALSMHERNGHINHGIVDDRSLSDNNGNGFATNGNSDTVWSNVGRRRSVAIADGGGGGGRRLSLAPTNGNQLSVPAPPTNWTHRGSLARASLSGRTSLDSFDE